MIDENKKYKFRNGENPHLIVFDVPYKYAILSIDMQGSARRHDSDGKSIHGNPVVDDDFDLVEVAPYEDIKRGDAVIVWDCEKEPVNAFVRVFSRVSDLGKPAVFYNKDTDDFFENCRKATEEDFK